MALRIITGTLTEATDPFDLMYELQEGSLLDRYYWTSGGWRKKPAKSVGLGAIRNGEFNIIQPTSVGKTVLAATFLFNTYIHGGNIAANLCLKWTRNEVRSLQDLRNLVSTHVLIDDLKSTIIDWKSKNSALVSEVANAGGKKNNQIDTTVQRIVFAPPDLRELCDEIIVPWIIKADLTRDSPRGPNKGVPIEIVPLKFTAGYEYLGYDHTFRYDNETGEEILSGFDTLQIANGLKEREEVKK